MGFVLWHGRAAPCFDAIGGLGECQRVRPKPKGADRTHRRTGLIVNHRNNTKLHQFEHILAGLWQEHVKIMPLVEIKVFKA